MSRKFNFTLDSIEQLPPATGKSPEHYYDIKVPGLWLRVTRTGVKAFIVKRWAAGKTQTIQLGRFSRKSVLPAEFQVNPLCVLGNNSELTVEQARLLALAVIGELAVGQDPNDERRRRREEMTLGELFEEYFQRHVSKKCKTAEVMKVDFERDLGCWAKRPLSSISNHDVEKLHGLMAKDRGPYRANRTVQLLRALYNKGIEWKLFGGDNPARGITLFEEMPRERFLSDEEVKRFLNVLSDMLALADQQHGDKSCLHFPLLCLFTGQRKSNVRSMRWDQINWDKRTWEIPANQMKNNKSHVVTLTGFEIAILRERLEANEKLPAEQQSPFVLPGTGKTGYLMDPRKTWQRIRKDAAIPGVTIHDLRRSLGSWMASKNVNVALIKGALNHKDLKTTLNVYARTAKEAERAGRKVAHNAMLRAAGLASPTPLSQTAVKKPSNIIQFRRPC